MNNVFYSETIIPPAVADKASIRDIIQLKRMLLFTKEDEQYLQLAGEVLSGQAEELLDAWYGYILGNDYLAYYFTMDGQPDKDYLHTLRPRFSDWIRSLCQHPVTGQFHRFEEMISRHLQEKSTDSGKQDAISLVYLRYLITFIYPVTNSSLDYLSRKGHSRQEVAKMHQAWFKAVCMSVALWIYPAAGTQK